MTAQAIGRRLARLCEKVGLKAVAYGFRHGFTIDALALCVPDAVEQIPGADATDHESERTKEVRDRHGHGTSLRRKRKNEERQGALFARTRETTAKESDVRPYSDGSGKRSLLTIFFLTEHHSSPLH